MAYKRFLLFTYYQYYPSGGENDVAGSFDTLEAAKDAAHEGVNGYRYDHAEVLDLAKRTFVWSGRINDR